MALSELESGYIGSPEKWRVFIKKFAISKEINDQYQKSIDYKKSMNKPVVVDLSIENFNKDFYELKDYSQKDFPCSSFNDFRRSGIFGLLKYVDYVGFDIFGIVDPIMISRSKYKNKKFFNNLIYEDVPDDLYYSYNTWQHKIYQYNGGCNPEFITADYNMMLGELGFGFQQRKKASYYDKALVVGDYYDTATGFLLPNELTKDGEMEAWLIDAEDVHRFRSFAEMMIWNLIAA